jgi:NADH dehydrogenase FAD-containing subunit
MRTRILILGTGIGGLEPAASLSAALGVRDDCQITLVNPLRIPVSSSVRRAAPAGSAMNCRRSEDESCP